MRRREFVTLAGGAAFALPSMLRAQTGGRIPLVVISFGTAADDPFNLERAAAVKSGMTRLGWVEGSNIRYELVFGDGSLDLMQARAEKILAAAPDVIVSSGTAAAIAFHKATTTIPVVFANVADPVAGGLVASLSRPGGNMTGFTPFEYGIGGKWLQLLQQVAPAITRATLLGDAFNPNFSGFWPPFESAAAAQKIEPAKIAAGSAEDIEKALRALAEKQGGGIVVTASQFSITHRKLIFRLAEELKLPAVYWARFFAQTGGLLSYGPNFIKHHEQAAGYVDRILRGEKPGNLPVQFPTDYEMVLNAKTAGALGLTISPLLLAQADEVIE